VPDALHSILAVNTILFVYNVQLMVFSTAKNATHFACNVRICCLRLTKQTVNGFSSALIGIVDGAKRACPLAAVGEHDFAKPADVKEAVGDLEAEKTQGTRCTPYSVLKRLPNVAITFLTTVFNATPARWCLSQHGTGHARFPS
jgi:hypothetical protein